ncbi:MAG: rod shape-determining protein RodA [Chloroflexota bacterium]|nr:rod shape-determining protein RodA [Chloroflexia bacterium]MDQ3442731.1 rod shape-determining protein RodA [Chloroflexota bacterium]
MISSRHNRSSFQIQAATNERWRDFDVMLFLTMFVLMIFGAVTIWSAVGLPAPTTFNIGTQQFVFGIVGIAMMLIVASIDYRYFESLAWVVYALGILGLLSVLSPLGVALEGTGARNWIDLGFTTIQPSEFTKVTTIIALCAFISSRGEAMKEFGNFVIAGMIVAIPTFMVLIGPDLGQAMVYIAFWGASLLVARTRKRYLWSVVLLLPLAIAFAWQFVLQDYQKERLICSFNPEQYALTCGYQPIQGRISIGAGGLLGAGLEGGTQSQMNLLNVRESDFIFAHASGMFGFLGMIALFLALMMFLWRGLLVAEISRDHFGQCLAVCIVGTFFFQAFLNIGMNLGVMPVAGITLPFVSAGISSLWSSLLMVGILQSIRMHHRRLAFHRR